MMSRTFFASASVSILSLTSFAFAPGSPALVSQAHTNRLAGESSPYLRQHAHNPVDWYPWRDDAFEKARNENKPIFLSIGYSACHWCHVMERESFENEEIARILNKDFVSIKVDREERPDVDDVYMTAVQVINRSGGWPMSVWLTPDEKPFYGATYFPPDRFKQVLGAITEAWKTKRPEIDKSANSIADAVMRQLRTASASSAIPPKSIQSDLLAELKSDYDTKNGGFGAAPKFPPHNAFPFLFYLSQHSHKDALAPALGTLDAMARGGIRDHLGGGFHRYSTDAQWLVPHFEKMLYDNALLATAYTEAYRITGAPLYKRVAMDTLDWAIREMRGPDGGFYSTLDADSEGVEGKYYVWRRSDIFRVLGNADGETFCREYQIADAGNYLEQATRAKNGSNILYRGPIDPSGRIRGGKEIIDKLNAMERKLLAERNKRIRPGLDDKRQTSWNGLIISALARAGAAFHEPRYTYAAAQAADYVLRPLLRDGHLVHSQPPTTISQPRKPVFLEDYAYLLMGLLDLYDATRLPFRLNHARAVADAMVKDLADPSGGFFDSTGTDPKLFARAKSGYDSATPCPNGVAAQALVRLATATGEGRYRELAGGAIRAFGGLITRSPRSAQTFLLAAAEYQDLARPQTTKAAPSLPQRASKGPVTLTGACDSGMPGGTVRLTIRIAIKPGWHINSTSPLDNSLIPTTVHIEVAPGFSASRSVFPSPKRVRLGFSKEDLTVFENEVIVASTVTISRNAKVGSEARATIRLRYQACDDSACQAPETLTISIPINVIWR